MYRNFYFILQKLSITIKIFYVHTLVAFALNEHFHKMLLFYLYGNYISTFLFALFMMYQFKCCQWRALCRNWSMCAQHILPHQRSIWYFLIQQVAVALHFLFLSETSRHFQRHCHPNHRTLCM